MSKPFQRTLGLLLVMLAAAFAYMDKPGAGGRRVLGPVVLVLGVAGLLVFLVGMANPLSPEARILVRRRIDLTNVVLGPIVVALSVLVLVLEGTVGWVSHGLLIAALVGVPGGLILTTTVFAYACSRCGARLRAGGVEARSFDYCPTCRRVLVEHTARGPVVLRGDEAGALIRRLDEK